MCTVNILVVYRLTRFTKQIQIRVAEGMSLQVGTKRAIVQYTWTHATHTHTHTYSPTNTHKHKQ